MLPPTYLASVCVWGGGGGGGGRFALDMAGGDTFVEPEINFFWASHLCIGKNKDWCSLCRNLGHITCSYTSPVLGGGIGERGGVGVSYCV